MDNFAFLAFQIAIPIQMSKFPSFLLTLWWARNNFGVIFLLCVDGFRLVYISRSCLLRSEGLYLKIYFSQVFKFSELKLQI